MIRNRCRVSAERAAVWAALGDVEAYRDWWPWLRRFEADGLRAGAVWRCLVQPPLPYTVRFDLTLHRVIEPERVEADAARAELSLVGIAERLGVD